MKQYLDLLSHIRQNGRFKADRTGTGTTAVFGYQMRFDLNQGFPLVTTKKLHLRAIIHELLWFLKGDTNNESLRAVDVKIWDEWALAEDETVPVRLGEHERLELYAAHLGLSTARAANEHLRGLYDKVRDHSAFYSLSDADDHAEKVMTEAGIPLHSQEVVRPKGDLGPIYGKQWRSWEGADGEVIDQLADVIAELKRNPTSRRLVVSAWNVADLPRMALQPCHTMFQFYGEELTEEERWAYQLKRDGHPHRAAEVQEIQDADFRMLVLDELSIPRYRLSCQLYQRSGDVFLGVPFNIASYALLTHMVAQVCGMAVGDFVHTLGDAHIYSNHVVQVTTQLEREPKALPTLMLNPAITDIDDFTFDDIKIVGYESHPAIKGAVAV